MLLCTEGSLAHRLFEERGILVKCLAPNVGPLFCWYLGNFEFYNFCAQREDRH